MCKLFWYNAQNVFVTFSQSELSHFSGQSEKILGIFCVQLSYSFMSIAFDTLQMFWLWSEDVHMFWTLPSDDFLIFFYKLNLVPLMALLLPKWPDLILGVHNSTPTTILCWLFWNFTGAFVIVSDFK